MNTSDTSQLQKDELMRSLDRESATRIWVGRPKLAVSAFTALVSVYCIWSTLFSTSALEIRLTSFLGLILIVGYLNYPADRHHVKVNDMPVTDLCIMILGAAAFFWFCFNYTQLAQSKVLSSASKMTPFMIVVAFVGIASCFELCRRCVGIPILCVVGVLLIYTFFNKYNSTGSVYQTLQNMAYTLFYTTGGILSTPVQVCAKFIAVFIIFGAFLERTGIASFFISCANALVGSSSGGPAKVAVVSSALCGMVSGSSVGNTVTTGSVTIPMMKKTGYKPEFAGAVEAAASTGGQIMPPIMGAAAFLMAEYMGISYSKVALYAILPAILYFTGIFIAVHLEAKKLGLKGLPKEQLPQWKDLVKDVYLLIPLILLIVLVSTNTRTLAYSASLAIIASILVALPEIFRNNKKETGGVDLSAALKQTGTMIFQSLEAGGKGCVTVVSACSMAGLIAGCITVTGLASRLISTVIALSSSIPNASLALFTALFLTMLCCIVLGMGVPTTANYCIMASTCAPILITLGINKVAAHFFVFYFGIVADITPPVALAAFAGAAIAGSDPIKTGINATKLAIGAFVVPYIFAMNPSMLLMNEGPLQAVLVIVTSFIGIFAIAAALNGYIFRKLTLIEKLLLIAGGITLLIPGVITDVIGIGLVALVLVLQKVYNKA